MPDSPPRGYRDPLILASVALLVVALHLAYSTGYGYFRDEFYFLDCANHLAPGYVDHAPLSIFLLVVERGLFGTSMPALRLLPALAAGALVFLTGWFARDLGADLMGQMLAAIAAGLAPVLMVQTGYYSMNAYEPIFWSAAAMLLVHILRSGNQKLWLWFGLLAGLGLENKHSTMFFLFGVAIGLILTRERRQLMSAWFWVGAALALAIFLPNVVWQILHGWPTLEFLRGAARNDYHPSPTEFLAGQILMLNPVCAPLWLAGLWFYFSSPRGRDLRAIGWTYVAMFAVFAIQGAKDYYLAPAYPILFAGGAVAIEEWIANRWNWIRPAYLALLSASGLAIAPMVVPILTSEQFISYARTTAMTSVPTDRKRPAPLPQHFADRFGWNDKVAAIADVYHSLSPDERSHAALLAENYGEAGAIDFLGPRYGLPHAYSAHNSYWIWGPPPDSTQTLITLGVSRDNLQSICGSIAEAAVVTCQYCMPYENNLSIFVCRDLKQPPREWWSSAKHFG